MTIIQMTDNPDNDNDRRLSFQFSSLTASFMGSQNKLGLSILGISNYSRGGGREEGFLSYIEITDPLDDLF